MNRSLRTTALLLITLHLAGCTSPKPEAAPPPPGLSVHDGRLMLAGKPYRGVGVNYFDVLNRMLRNPQDRSGLAGLEQLGAEGIPFVRFAVGFNSRDREVFFTDRQRFFAAFDAVVLAAERANVGLIPSLFWHFMDHPDTVGEPRGQWGDPASRTHAKMREMVGAIVRRYHASPAIWAWEFGNEPNLMADLPNAAQFRKPGGSEADDLTSEALVVMLSEFAQEVRRHDGHRPIISGNSHPRASSWHNTAEKSWKPDTREQTLAIIRRDNPPPLDTISIHVYASHDVGKDLGAWAADHAEYLRTVMALAREMKRPVFVGEFGAPISDDPAAVRRAFEHLLSDLETTGVDLAAMWVYDLPNQSRTWNATFDNDRAYMLKLTAEANRRWSRSGE